MHGLLGLLSLAPKEPNILDSLFGKYAVQSEAYQNSLDIAVLMTGVFLAALLWRGLRTRELGEADKAGKRKTLIQALAPDLDANLSKPEVLTWANRGITAALVVLALLSSVNYFYGTRNNGVYLHRWDAFHTVMGVKYFDELGYFDLYKCAYAIDRDGPHHFRSVKKIRDLRTRKFVDRDQHIADNDCKERFTPERLEMFKADLAAFGDPKNNLRQKWSILFKDKGFNGTPFYATVCKPFVNSVTVELESMRKLAFIDPFLMMVAFGVVGWAFGVRRAAILAIFFCVFFPNRFTHMGGSILRFDYMATLLIGFSALKKDKWGLAGGMFAWATMVRVFPAIFAVGVGFKILADVWRDGELKIREEHWRFVGVYAGLIALFFLISLVGMNGGLDNWQVWAENMKVHSQTSASFRVGFKHLFMLDGSVTGTDYGAKQVNFEARQSYYWLAVALLMGPLLLSVRRLDIVSFGALFGVIGFFTLAIATRYYYGVVAILFLVDRELLRNRFMLILGALLFAAASFDFFYFELNDSDALMYNIIVGVELTLVAGALASWLVFNPSLLDVGLDPRLPVEVPAKLGAAAAPVALTPTKKKAKKKKKTKTKAKAKTTETATETDGETDGEKAPESEIATLTRAPEGESPEAESDDETTKKAKAKAKALLAELAEAHPGVEPDDADPLSVTISDLGAAKANDRAKRASASASGELGADPSSTGDDHPDDPNED